jgi:phosphoribosylformylglycinamidine cyclo-ligase
MICSGATPLMFLDYYATGKLELEDAKSFLLGVQKACDESMCALVGGETAEMPGVYQVGDFDCVGFAVGVVDQVKALGSQLVEEGDVLLGVSSSGFHSNGYSLLRKLFEKDLEEWKDVLLRPTHLYVQLMEALKAEVKLHAAANMTGSGIENIPRVIPDHLAWQMKTWTLPPEFIEVQKRSGLSLQELLRTLNCGVGFVLILPEVEAIKARTIVEQKGYTCYDLGKIAPRVIGKDQIL